MARGPAGLANDTIATMPYEPPGDVFLKTIRGCASMVAVETWATLGACCATFLWSLRDTTRLASAPPNAITQINARMATRV